MVPHHHPTPKGRIMETEKKLTPELVLMAITSGMLDDSLDALKEVIRSRKDILNVRKSASLEPGDTFITQNVRPKKWEGLIVEFVRHEGIWLVCRLNEADARRIHNIS